MKRKNAARNALFTSVISLLLCVSMLVGTTFAWFTDSVTSAGNKVVAGNLDVDLYQWTAADASTEITNESDPLFAESILWEPGKTQVVYLSIKNNGSLSLKYKVSVSAKDTDAGQDLYEAMRYAIIPDAKFATVTAWDATNAKAVVPGINATEASSVNMAPNAEHFFALAIHMNEEAGNKYQGGSVEFDIRVDATQLTAESDSFGTDYDADAALPVYAIGTAPVATSGHTTITVENKNTATPRKVAVVNVPEAAVEEDTKEIKVTIIETEDPAGFVVNTNEASVTFDVEVTGINGEEEIDVELFVGTGLTGVVLYHNGVEMDPAKYSYSAASGYIRFLSKDFSPFTIVYDAVKEPAAPSEPSEPSTPSNPTDKPEGIPVAVVTDVTGSVNVGPWKSEMGIPAADPEQGLAVVYKYECPTGEYDAKYDDWYCDFYVSVNRDIEENQLFLGGEYGTWGWIGFNAPAVEKDIEIALLASAVSDNGLVTRGGGSDTGWTYDAIKNFVGVFHCGVAQVYNSTADLAGLEFTVKLSLTNPENPNEYYDVNTVTYTFPETATVVTTAEDLSSALTAGANEIKVKGNITLTKSLGASNVTLIGVGEDAGINFNGYNIGGTGTITYKNLNLSTVSLAFAPENGERYGWYGGIDYTGHSVSNYEDCIITGVFTTYSPIVNATNCTFNSYVQDGEEYYNIFLYSSGTVNATNCTFMYRDRGIKIYSEGPATFTLNIVGGKFVATTDYTVNKALINVDSTYFTSANIKIEGVEIDSKLSSAAVHNAEGNAKVTVTIK